jgi:transcriptional regulator with XRE-family HTH domain
VIVNVVVDNIEKIRKAKGMSKTFLAKRLEMSLQGYRYSVSSDSALDTARIKKISLILNVKPGIFFDDQLTQTVINELIGLNCESLPAASRTGTE